MREQPHSIPRASSLADHATARLALQQTDQTDRALALTNASGTVRPQTVCSDTGDADRPRSHTCIPALPFCTATLTTEKPKDSAYPTRLVTLGDHIRRRRLDLRLLQREVAELLGVCKSVVWRWETGETEPELRFLPKVFGFIGGDPRPEPTGIGARLIRWREQKGWSRKRLASHLAVDEGTLWRWESGQRCPGRLHSVKIHQLLADHPDPLKQMTPP